MGKHKSAKIGKPADNEDNSKQNRNVKFSISDKNNTNKNTGIRRRKKKKKPAKDRRKTKSRGPFKHKSLALGGKSDEKKYNEISIANRRDPNITISPSDEVFMERDGFVVLRMPRPYGPSQCRNLQLVSMLGFGIISTLSIVQRSAGSLGMVSVTYFVSGIHCLLSCAIYSELSGMINKSGCDYAYVHLGYGHIYGFIRLYVDLSVIFPVKSSIYARRISDLILLPFYPNCYQPEYVSALISVSLLMFAAIMQMGEQHTYDRFISYCLYALTVVYSTLIVYGVVTIDLSNFKKPFFETTPDYGELSVLIPLGHSAYFGWNTLPYIAEEIRHPKKVITTNMVRCTFLVFVCNLLFIVFIYGRMTNHQIVKNYAIANHIARSYNGFGCLLTFAYAIGMVGAMAVNIHMYSRALYLGARQKLFPPAFGMLNFEHMIPRFAIVASVLVTVFYMYLTLLLHDKFSNLLIYVSMIELICGILGAHMVLKYRKMHPFVHRPYIVFNWVLYLYILIFWIGSAICIVYQFGTVFGSFALISVGVPAYMALNAYSENYFIIEIIERWTMLIQKVLLVSVEEAPNKY